ncbi:hypothetical protein [Natrinema salaciae]|uniref:Uncharacterized protein n=1 Tax=Natrinema salaciae TaxID=1186196 RepID=A0A1H9CPW1_9EURY|nr:hypothetical protein [Natrinema salaciae]SEQ03097.1 hypothetical protein SAMN04489841_1117 [Natrinema salaciae]
MQRTDMVEWEKIAEAIHQLQDARSNLLRTLTGEGNVPKSVYRTQYERVEDSTSKLKSDLEDRMFEEHPDEASIDVFYGSSDE